MVLVQALKEWCLIIIKNLMITARNSIIHGLDSIIVKNVKILI